MKQFIILVLIVALISGIYYLLSSPQLPKDTAQDGEISDFDPAGLTSAEIINDSLDFNSSEPNNEYVNIESDGSIFFSRSTEHNQNSLVTGRRLEIFGRVVDEYKQPIDNTLVAEERYFYSTRTDSEGKYKIFVDMPNSQYPVLRFLRSGFRDKRVELDAEALKDRSVLELDVELYDDLDSLSLDGWIGNDIGVGLGGLKIQITSRNNHGLDIVFHTVFSDEKGYFSLEGIRSGDPYKLTVFSTPEYLYYVDEKFTVTQNTPQLNIILESLNFVDIGGMIVNSNGVPIPNFEIYLSNISTGTHVRKIVTDSSGFFNLRNFPAGDVRLSTQGPEYFKIEGLTLSASEYRNLRLVVDKGGHYLSGWVSDENGVPLAKVLVQLNARIQEGPIEYSSYRVKGTDSAGKFYFDNLGGGAHLLSVDTYGFNRQEIIHRFESQSDEMHIILSRRK